jgi:hypothetical protein
MGDKLYWTEFCNTYDIQYLNFLSEQAKNLLFHIVNKPDKYFKFKGLKRIIMLYFKKSWLDLIECNYLSGVSSLSYHRLISSPTIKIYIFGESAHNKCSLKIDGRICVGLGLIINIIRNEPKFIDLFINSRRLSDYSEFSNITVHDTGNTENVKEIMKKITEYVKTGKDSRNILIYIDEKYVDNLRNELKTQKFKMVNSSISKKGEDCINISKFHFHFFNI